MGATPMVLVFDLMESTLYLIELFADNLCKQFT